MEELKGESGDFFILAVEKRDKVTLLNIIRERIVDVTTIISDCWKACAHTKYIETGNDMWDTTAEKRIILLAT